MERPIPTGQERTFADHEIIVSKTDLKGRITYANQTFIEISGYTEEELLGQPHNLIRHPDMPRCVFKLLWDTIQAGEEIFAYVVNLCKNGDHYWVLAHVTPTWNLSGQISGYHSSRRVPERKALEKVIPLYRSLKRIEGASSDWRTGMQNATVELLSQLDAVGMEYDEYVFAL
ncbi:PAS domain-containing protein [Gimesia chilikensis]|uniref:PAS domain-containing protein n=1 Tax=Gimesia chilikensis TaxID=2605989 RepID=UPI003A93E542